MVRGILMSKEGQKAILLTKDGTFQKVRLKKDARVTVGQSVLDSDIALRPAVVKKIPMSLAACLTVIIVFSLISGFVKNNAIAAYVSFDVNPSIEAAINGDFRVVKVRGLNEEGKAILNDGINYTDMPLEEFSLAIADALSERGYLTDKPDIVVSTIVTDKVEGSDRENFLSKINQAVNKVKNNQAFKNNNGSLEVINTTMDRRQEATKAGISTGKYLIYLKEEKGNSEGKGKGNPIKLSDVKQMSVKELRHGAVKKQNTVQVDATHPKGKGVIHSNKKHNKKNNNGNDGQQIEGELVKNKAEEVATQHLNLLKSIKKGNPHNHDDDIKKKIPSKRNKNIGPQNDFHKENKGNDKKQYKNAG